LCVQTRVCAQKARTDTVYKETAGGRFTAFNLVMSPVMLKLRVGD
jgi:hypothetical protein